MSALDYIFQRADQYVIDKGFNSSTAKHPIAPEHGPVLRATLRSIYPKLSPDRINALQTHLGPYVGDYVSNAIGTGKLTTKKQIEAVQNLAYTESPYGKSIRALSDILFRENPNLKLEDTAFSTQQGKQTLRSRYGLPGEDTLRESKQQMVLDTSIAEMFSYHPPEIGISLLNEYNKQNQRMAMQSPSQPRSTYDQQLMPFEMAWQYQQFPIDPIMEQLIEESARVAFVKNLPPRFDVLGDVQANGTPFIDAVNQRKSFGPDPFYQVPVGYTNYLGFKPDQPFAWRDPLQPAPQLQNMGKRQMGQGGIVDFQNFPGPQLLF